MTLAVLCFSHLYATCHQDELMIFKWTTHARMLYGQPEFPATLPCRLWLTPKSLTHDFAISVNDARIIGRTVQSVRCQPTTVCAKIEQLNGISFILESVTQANKKIEKFS